MQSDERRDTILSGREYRERNLKSSTLARIALNVHEAAMSLDDALSDGETQTRAVLFCREEGFKQSTDIFSRNS